MRLINLDEYRPQTMELARPIFDKYKRVLLAEGRSIHPTFLKRLGQMDIRYLFVEDAISKGITMEEMIDMPTWMEAIQVVQLTFESTKKKGAFPFREIQETVKKLVAEVYKRGAVVLVPTTFLAEELRDYAHAVNVALLSTQLGKKKGLNQMQVKDLALGALLHDIGKVEIEGEGHAQAGFEILRKIREVGLLSAHVAYQHHEMVEGSGYPRGINGTQIQEYAQICAIANTFENMISSQGYAPHEVIEYIMTKSGSCFREDLVHLFVREVPLYPPGTKIRLNTGEQAIVTKVHKNPQRPDIRILDTKANLSLADHPTLLVSEVLVDEEKYTEEAK
ncbi:HD-GYP domain-containing protein [Peribacillus alkalitolerans]|uniref:HD-GYP domain-containing protein n=1 Tax=Peribacillus alkalitolerans TaxID=1550385 RepID=UPI0013D84982|nr:HD domain-containing phosphohydrolase [Peribacillus alkalitolerans]